MRCDALSQVLNCSVVILASLVAFILAILMWILFTPVRARVDTAGARYQISQRGTLLLAWHPGQQPSMELRVFGIGVPLTAGEARRKPPKKKQRKGVKKSLRAWTYLVKGFLSSIKLRELTANVDTDDVVLNAKLIPVAVLLTKGVVSVGINFQGHRDFRLDMECRPSKWLWTFLVFLTIK